MENGTVRDMIAYIVENLVEFPDQVEINELENDETVTYQLKVAPSDMGKVIGRQGRIAKEIRVLAKAAGQREHKKVMVDILD